MTDRSLATLPTLRDVLARAHLRMIVFSVLIGSTPLWAPPLVSSTVRWK